ncbi:MAG: serine/threonine-protein kinase [Nannocystaceae bacterium]
MIQPGDALQGPKARYRIERSLGAGGFAETWLARREPDGLRVAIKTLSLARLGEWKALELFDREAKVLAALGHPAIPRVHEYFAVDPRSGALLDPAALEAGALPAGVAPVWHLVQDFIDGRSLRQLIADQGRLDNPAAERILRELLGVLAYLHSRHPPVIHRDIHPGNVLLRPDGAPALVDFGAIQERLRGEGSGGSTTIGTFGYVPMEQLMGKARPASDLYALGVTMIVALTHREPEALPFDEATSTIQLDEAAPGLSPGLRRALGAMTLPVLGARPQTAEEALGLLDGGGALARPGPTAAAPAGAPVEARALARWRAVGAASIGLGCLAAGVIYLAMFNAFSETALIQISPLWLAPVAFGVGLRRSTRAPLTTGLLYSGIAVAGLIVFIYGIFPAL